MTCLTALRLRRERLYQRIQSMKGQAGVEELRNRLTKYTNEIMNLENKEARNGRISQ